MFVVSLTVVTDDLHPSRHLANGEEAQNFRRNDRDCGKLAPINVADRAQHSLRVDRAGRRTCGRGERSRIAKNVGDRLKIGLEMSDRAEGY